MPNSTPDDPNTFFVETNFQKMARRAGGVPREQALENARVTLETIKLGFRDWLDGEISDLAAQIRRGRTRHPPDVAWAEAALNHCRQIRDVGGTMGFQLVTFIAGNLCKMLDGIVAGANPSNEMIDCHIDALCLAKQEQYRHLSPEQLPELSDGLRRVLEAAHSSGAGIK
ncbi:MAG TPA: hypothetical protein VNL39_11825 [Xanthobacteraceae bacterium]|nr:hypothetical protein [Xanthobacteraceae bacterium]